MSILNKTGVTFDEFRIYRKTELDLGSGQEVTKWYATVGYTVETQEGESWHKQLERELTGPIKTKAVNMLTAVRDAVLQHEGLVP